jgi:hypothetical protein
MRRKRSMVTATRSETTQTTVPRLWLCQVQARSLLSRTTDIGEDCLEKIGNGLTHHWLWKIGVYGLDTKNRVHAWLELWIDWVTHTQYVLAVDSEVTIDRSVYPDNLVPEVQNGIRVFNQAVIEEGLQTEWRVFYCKGVDEARVDRELGLETAAPLQLAGKVKVQACKVGEVPELRVVFLRAIPTTDEGNEQDVYDGAYLITSGGRRMTTNGNVGVGKGTKSEDPLGAFKNLGKTILDGFDAAIDEAMNKGLAIQEAERKFGTAGTAGIDVRQEGHIFRRENPEDRERADALKANHDRKVLSAHDINELGGLAVAGQTYVLDVAKYLSDVTDNLPDHLRPLGETLTKASVQIIGTKLVESLKYNAEMGQLEISNATTPRQRRQ